MITEFEFSSDVISELESIAKRLGVQVAELAQTLIEKRVIFFNTEVG